MIVSLHVATGAAAGALLDSRIAALAVGPLLHIAGDRIPHEDLQSRRFEIACGAGGIALLALLRGPLDPATLGAIAASAEDLEHVLPLPRPGGRKLFPSHRNDDWHNRGGVPAWMQLVAAGVIIGALLRR
jgi:hypothetical protein